MRKDRLIGGVLGVAGLLLLCAPARAMPERESTPLGPAPATGSMRDGSPAPASRGTAAIGETVRTVAALGFVVGLAFLAGAVARRTLRSRGGLAGAIGPGGPSPSGVLEILGRYPVGSGQTLVLLRLDRRILLLHQGGGGRGASMRTLSEIADPDEVASILLKTRDDKDASVQQGFREAMRRLEREFDEPTPERFRAPASNSDGDRVELLRDDRSGGMGAGDVVTLRARLGHWIREARA
jgi:flagellar biogenesis protein FliO